MSLLSKHTLEKVYGASQQAGLQRMPNHYLCLQHGRVVQPMDICHSHNQRMGNAGQLGLNYAFYEKASPLLDHTMVHVYQGAEVLCCKRHAQATSYMIPCTLCRCCRHCAASIP